MDPLFPHHSPPLQDPPSPFPYKPVGPAGLARLYPPNLETSRFNVNPDCSNPLASDAPFDPAALFEDIIFDGKDPLLQHPPPIGIPPAPKRPPPPLLPPCGPRRASLVCTSLPPPCLKISSLTARIPGPRIPPSIGIPPAVEGLTPHPSHLADPAGLARSTHPSSPSDIKERKLPSSMPGKQNKLACRKAGCRFRDLVQKAELELALLDLQLIDDAEDAAFLGSDLSLGQTEDALSVDMPKTPTESILDSEEPSANSSILKRKREEAEASSALPPFEASNQKIPSTGTAGSPEDVNLTRQQRRNRHRRTDRKAKAAAVQSKRRALYRKAELVALQLDPTSLPHSSQGYIGSTKTPDSDPEIPGAESGAEGGSVYEGPLPVGVDYLSHPRLLHLVRSGYSVVPSSTEPSLFLDQDNRIIGWRVGVTGGAANEARWDEQNADLTASLETLAQKMENRKASAPGVPRGEHSWAHWGYSYGGGERRPTSRQQTKQERTWWGSFLSQPAYVNTTKTILDSWKTWAPNVLSDYTQCHLDILERQPNLDRVHAADPDNVLPFASLTANLGPQTVCQAHRDIKNKASGGICGIKILGSHNWRLGGHIVLHELGLIVEMRPGDIIFFPSAVITHETIPVGPNEKRYSLVWYSAGGLFRWCDANFRSLRNWETQDPTGYNTHQQKGEARWADGWKNFSTLSELVAQSERILTTL